MDKIAVETLNALMAQGGYSEAEDVPRTRIKWCDVTAAAYRVAGIIGNIEAAVGDEQSARMLLAMYLENGDANLLTRDGPLEDRSTLSKWMRELVVFSMLNEETEASLIALDLPGPLRDRSILCSAILVDGLPQRWIAEQPR